ncbi:hypothetical protein ACSVIJ_04945 [Pseudomonas sp. NCHU5208]|uniref:hypothetical protein n=1 Tax=unclassified Pseudomonas TaxID=196821 RepID=UPI003F989EA3
MPAAKAFIVETDDPDDSVVKFATTNVAARRNGADEIGADFGNVTCKRLPWADQYAGKGIPPTAFIENGWHYECSTCGDKVGKETPAPVFALDLSFCSAKCHAVEVADRQAAADRKQEVIDALLAKFPGVEVAFASDHDERRSARFRFPGGQDTVEWKLGEDTVMVSKRDIEAWNAWRDQVKKADCHAEGATDVG